MDILPLKPDPVDCSDDHGRADTEDFDERPVGVPAFEVGMADPTFGVMVVSSDAWKSGSERRVRHETRVTPGKIVPSNKGVITSNPFFSLAVH